jgi:acyl carrier protein phosphodiesterase
MSIFKWLASYMNFLAHIYLSGDSKDLLIGNFIGDYIKGKEYEKYPPGIQEGIHLHRKIDDFTDSHSVTRKAKLLVRERYGLYSGIVIDIFYDHFLSANWMEFCDTPLRTYVRQRYRMLDSGFSMFPIGVKTWFPYFIKSNWLEAYTTFQGLVMVFKRMSYRTSLPDHSEYAVESLQENYELMDSYFRQFFQEIRSFVSREYEIPYKGLAEL